MPRQLTLQLMYSPDELGEARELTLRAEILLLQGELDDATRCIELALSHLEGLNGRHETKTRG